MKPIEKISLAKHIIKQYKETKQYQLDKDNKKAQTEDIEWALKIIKKEKER